LTSVANEQENFKLKQCPREISLDRIFDATRAPCRIGAARHASSTTMTDTRRGVIVPTPAVIGQAIATQAPP